MKKNLFSLIAASMMASPMMAGGLLTNSNQSASFLRNPARDAIIDIDGVYTNPAGVCFMNRGFHFGFTLQHPEQQRNVTTTFAGLAQNINHFGESTHLFKGQASAPVVPSFQAAYVMDKWTYSASFAFSGGGGKCEFDDGIGSIESVFSMLPTIAQVSGFKNVQAYDINAFMKGRQYYYGVQLGAGYKINDHVAVFAGLRAVIGTAKYEGYVNNIKLYTDVPSRTELPAKYTQQLIQGVAQQMGVNLADVGNGDINMSTSQSCVGWTPVIGVDWRINDHWNIAAKYEFRTKMALKNSTDMNAFARKLPMLDKFNDETNKTVRDDVPGTLAIGVQYSPIQTVRINGGFHFYDDKNAKRYNDEQKLIDSGTREFLAGVEWDATKRLTVSAGWQNTHYSLSDAYMQDMSYNCSSNLLGVGVRVNVSEKVSLDLGYMHNFYQDRTVENKNYQIGSIVTSKTDIYQRKNDVVAVGINLSL